LDAVLERLPVRIVRALSGEEALARSAEQEFALILLICGCHDSTASTPRGSCAKRDPARQPPVIILTAHLPALDEIKTAYAAGVVDFLQKPYAAEVLVAKVSVFVELHVQREKLRLYERALRERFQQDLVGVVSHDLRSPLNAISLAAESMRQRGETTERDRRSLHIIQSAAGRAARLVRDLLDTPRSCMAQPTAQAAAVLFVRAGSRARDEAESFVSLGGIRLRAHRFQRG